MGALVRCWRCDKPFRPSWEDERVCSPECAREWRSEQWQRGRTCLACGRPINPQRRADARFCSAKCRERVHRRLANERHVESVRELVADDFRELHEAWRRARKANPSGYTRTPLADRLREEQQRIHAIFDRRDHRSCDHCGKRIAMRKGQRYCSNRCRVAAFRVRRSQAS